MYASDHSPRRQPLLCVAGGPSASSKCARGDACGMGWVMCGAKVEYDARTHDAVQLWLSIKKRSAQRVTYFLRLSGRS